ncbi:hypothetical protein GCM10007937_01780 [Mesorhizobium albiziae]|nr:hypothetical protein GCM10007937_01780 [Mesorhizobium albiziae]
MPKGSQGQAFRCPLLAAAAIAAAFTLPAYAGQIDEMPYIKAWAYAQAIEDYCFGDAPDERLEPAAVAQAALAGISGSSLSTIADNAAKHLRGDQNACQAAADFVARAIAELPQLDAVVAAEKAKQEAEKQSKAAEATRKGDEERASQTAVCKADIADATEREAAAAPNATGPWIGLKALVIKCAPLVQVDASDLLARLEDRIKAQ